MGIWSGAKSLFKNGIYNTSKPLLSGENLFNVGMLAGSIGLAPFTGGLSLAGLGALGAKAGVQTAGKAGVRKLLINRAMQKELNQYANKIGTRTGTFSSRRNISSTQESVIAEKANEILLSKAGIKDAGRAGSMFGKAKANAEKASKLGRATELTGSAATKTGKFALNHPVLATGALVGADALDVLNRTGLTEGEGMDGTSAVVKFGVNAFQGAASGADDLAADDQEASAENNSTLDTAQASVGGNESNAPVTETAGTEAESIDYSDRAIDSLMQGDFGDAFSYAVEGISGGPNADGPLSNSNLIGNLPNTLKDGFNFIASKVGDITGLGEGPAKIIAGLASYMMLSKTLGMLSSLSPTARTSPGLTGFVTKMAVLGIVAATVMGDGTPEAKPDAPAPDVVASTPMNGPANAMS